MPEIRAGVRQRLSIFLLLAILLGGSYLYFASVYFPLDQQIILGWGLFLSLFPFKWAFRFNRHLQRVFLVLICLMITMRYFFFRTFDTLAFTGFWDTTSTMGLYLAECYGVLIFVLGCFVNIHPITRKPRVVSPEDPDLPVVDVLVPTFNEPEDVLRQTLTASTMLFYPREKLHIHLLDDGGTEAMLSSPDPAKAAEAARRSAALKEMASELGVHYRTRKDNAKAKAGNITEGLKSCNGELLLMLDSDNVPSRDLLLRTVGYFRDDEKLFLVQTPHFFMNPNPVEKNLDTFRHSPGENEMFYGAVHKGLDFWNSSFFCGTAAVLRTSHLRDVGGMRGDSVTEDAETSLDLHARGLNSVYVSRPMVCGLSPETYDDFVVQRNRWTMGMIQILVLKNPLFKRGLTLYQRLCYFNSCVFWLFGLARIVFFLAPLLFMVFGLRVYNASLSQILAYTLPHIMGTVFMMNYMFGHVRHPFFSELYETAQSIYQVPVIMRALLRPRSPRFKVTPKAGKVFQDFLSPLASPFYIMMVLCLLAYPMAVYRWDQYPLDHDAIIVCAVWTSFNLLLVLLCFGIVWESRQIRRTHRISTEEPGQLFIPSADRAVEAVVLDLSLEGVRVRVDESAGIGRRDKLELHAEDSYGQSYRLPLEAVRVGKTGRWLDVGCHFLKSEDEDMRRAVLSYVLGDSERWNRIWLGSERRTMSAAGGIAYLFGRGVHGTLRNVGGITRIGYRSLNKYMGAVWKGKFRSAG